jgi:hypothetical protein
LLFSASIILVYVYRCFPPFSSGESIHGALLCLPFLRIDTCTLILSLCRREAVRKRLLMRLLRGDTDPCGEPLHHHPCRRLNCSKINTQSLVVVEGGEEAICDIGHRKSPFKNPSTRNRRENRFVCCLSTSPLPGPEEL